MTGPRSNSSTPMVAHYIDNCLLKREPFSVDDPILARMKVRMGSIAAMTEHLKKQEYQRTPRGKMDRLRQVARQEYPILTRALDKPLREFFQTRNGNTFPAVDLAANSGYYTTQFAFRYRPPHIGGTLEWCPTDKRAETKTWDCLKYLAQEAEDNAFLFEDSNGGRVFRNDKVELVDLDRYEFNGKEAIALERDPKNNDRFRVQMEDNLRLRLKSNNLIKADQRETEVPTYEKKQQQVLASMGLDKAIFAGLLGRTTTLDLLKTETWSNVSELKDKCALVTCINLLRAIGKDEPEAWKNVLDLASRLLLPGGHLLQYDETATDDTIWGKYGNVKAMKEYVSANSLHLRVHNESIDNQRVLLVW
eukprot:CAMPEP_0119015470 /NCGR_PEP_ID=MMETSP1176-20130426/11080_1 /TAXON_ID=265551 /ORGANISM="Synedropsis recta cf, Strain CCMP1620" /LENGTH=362 /DNA_ID=CAMNT_0006968765 /DNA_START=209 /DNA_END=1294 /DNA_ORIENTATION=+